MALIDNCNAYWTLDNTLTDATGNGNTISNSGATYTASGKINGAYDFDGSNDYMTVPNSSDISFADDFTISFWLKPDDTLPSGTEVVLEKRGGTRNYVFLRLTSGVMYFRIYDGSNIPSIVGTTNLVSGQFYHIVGVRDTTNDELRLYIDGVLDGTVTDTTTGSITNTTDVLIGSRSGSNPFDGVLDEISMWSRDLSDSEITQLYNSGDGLQYPFGDEDTPVTPLLLASDL